MPADFNKDYFTKDSIYAKFKDAAEATQQISRWYYSFYRKIRRAVKFDIEGRNVLDVGCGYPGMLSLFHADGASCIGLDVSEFVIKCAGAVLPGAQFCIGDAQHVDKQLLGTQDLVLCLEVIEHVPGVDAMLDACIDLLAPGGYLALTTPNREMKIPGYGWDSDPTHISVMAMSDWRRKIEERKLQQVISTTFLTIPFIWRYNKHLNFTISLRDMGPTCLIVARKA